MQREGATLAAMDCLLAMARMVRQGLKDKTTSSVAAEKQSLPNSPLALPLLQDYRKHPEEASLKASEVAIFCYGRVLPLAFPARGGERTQGPSPGLCPPPGATSPCPRPECGGGGEGVEGVEGCGEGVWRRTEAMAAYLAADLDVLAFFLPGIASKVSALLLLAAGKGPDGGGGRCPPVSRAPWRRQRCGGALSCLGTV